MERESSAENSDYGAIDRWTSASLYDAVAGRINKVGTRISGSNPEITKVNVTPASPNQVLFKLQEAQLSRQASRESEAGIAAPSKPRESAKRRRNAFESHYFAAYDRLLQPNGVSAGESGDGPSDQTPMQLPDSDLLKAIHEYASDFYQAIFNKEIPDWGMFKSMDETALIAVGILLEEMIKDRLGATGDLVFTEGIEGGESSDENNEEDDEEDEEGDEEADE